MVSAGFDDLCCSNRLDALRCQPMEPAHDPTRDHGGEPFANASSFSSAASAICRHFAGGLPDIVSNRLNLWPIPGLSTMAAACPTPELRPRRSSGRKHTLHNGPPQTLPRICGEQGWLSAQLSVHNRMG
jgi:hypothetical protein